MIQIPVISCETCAKTQTTGFQETVSSAFRTVAVKVAA